MRQRMSYIREDIMVNVSAVIPTYNGTRYLADAVKSVLAQTYEVLEIIVVDDGSREDIEKIVSPFFPRVRYVRQENAGPAAARNYGISLAKGDVIALLDDDDVWHPAKTAEQLKVLTNNPKCGLVYSYPELIDEYGEVIPNEAPGEFPSGRVYREFLTRNMITTPTATMIRREVFHEIGFFDENKECISCEDYDLWLRIARKYELVYCPGVLVSYRIRNTGISRNLDAHLQANLFVIDKQVAQHVTEPYLTDCDFNVALDTNLNNMYRRFAHNYYNQYDIRDKARIMIEQSLKIKPFCVNDMIFWVKMSLPSTMFEALRWIKQKIAQLST